MPRALLDTDLIIWLLRGRSHARRWINELTRFGVPRCSALSVMEVVIGMRRGEERTTRALLGSVDVVPVGREIAWQAGEYIREYARRGVTLDFVDATIAATCRVERLTLATYNNKHFPMPEVYKMPVPP